MESSNLQIAISDFTTITIRVDILYPFTLRKSIDSPGWYVIFLKNHMIYKWLKCMFLTKETIHMKYEDLTSHDDGPRLGLR